MSDDFFQSDLGAIDGMFKIRDGGVAVAADPTAAKMQLVQLESLPDFHESLADPSHPKHDLRVALWRRLLSVSHANGHQTHRDTIAAAR